jgi:hypothetical protein
MKGLMMMARTLIAEANVYQSGRHEEIPKPAGFGGHPVLVRDL